MIALLGAVVAGVPLDAVDTLRADVVGGSLTSSPVLNGASHEVLDQSAVGCACTACSCMDDHCSADTACTMQLMYSNVMAHAL